MANPFSEDEIKNFLRNLKLTKYELDVYLTLLQHGPANYKEITKLSGVPYGKIYYTLKSLAKKGWIKSINGRPRIFYSADPQKPLQNYLVRIRKQMNDLEELFQQMIPQLQTLYKKSSIHPSF